MVVTFAFYVVSLYFIVRYERIKLFRYIILNACTTYNCYRLKKDATFSMKDMDANAIGWFYNKYSIIRLLFSLKPLRVENWYSEDELREITKGTNI